MNILSNLYDGKRQTFVSWLNCAKCFLSVFFIFFCVVWLRDRFSFKWFCSMTGLIDLDKKESLELKAFVSLYLPAVSADPVCS